MGDVVYCGCHETYPQLREGLIGHAPDCPAVRRIAELEATVERMRVELARMYALWRLERIRKSRERLAAEIGGGS